MINRIRTGPILMMLAMAAVAVAPRAALATSDGDAVRTDIQKTFGFIPGFMKLVPDLALPGAWMEFKGLLLNPATALPPKMKDLVGLAVAAQIPCKFCIIADTEFAKLEGASDREITEAVAVSGLVRHWSTIVNGRQADKASFKKDINRLVAGAKKHMAVSAPAGRPGATMTATK